MRSVRNLIPALVVCASATLGAGALAGCASKEPPPSPPRVRTDVPPRPYPPPMRERDEMKPLPEPPEVSEVPLPPYDDVPLVNQRIPEQRAYLNAYEAVGRPRIAVFVNRTLEGDLVPVSRQAPMPPEPRDLRYPREYDARDYGQHVDRMNVGDPAANRDTNSGYLRPGEYEETSARSIDYQAIENLLTDWLAAEGRVEVLAPSMARQRLSDPQVKDLQEGRPEALGGVARQLGSDVLVQVQARPTVQTHNGLQVRLVAEAVNVRGGQSIARAVAEVPPPLDKPQLNKYTRFLARRLMDGMSNSWRAMVSDPGRQRELDRDARTRARDLGGDRDAQAAPGTDGVTRPADERRDAAPAPAPQGGPPQNGPPPTSRRAVPTTRPSAPDPREPQSAPTEPSPQPPASDTNK